MALMAAYQTPGGPRYGLVIDGVVYTWDGDPFQTRRYEPGERVGAVTWLPPVRPSKIVCVGRNYAAHAAEHNAEVPQEPMIFLKAPSALIAHEQAIEFSRSLGRVEHESELAVVIGKTARRVSRADALDYVLGYTCANDVSARDLQFKDGQWGRAKGFDTFCPMGPWINTDLDTSDLSVRCYVNGQLKQDGRTSMMMFDVPHLVSFISHVMTLLPGDVIMTGTPSGVSPLADDDVVQVEIEGIGVLRSTVRTTE